MRKNTRSAQQLNLILKKGVKMRKFTLYQAARYSGISRYKLEQAIRENLLSVETGKGNIKCFINEDNLDNFIELHGDQYRKYTYTDEQKPIISAEATQFIPKELHERMLSEKERIIELLERQNNQMLPIMQSQANGNLLKKMEMLENCLDEALSNINDSGLKQAIQNRLKQTKTV